MKGKEWKKYILIVLIVLLYALELSLLWNYSHRMYKGIIEFNSIFLIGPILFLIWLFFSKEKSQAWMKNEKFGRVLAVGHLCFGVLFLLIPYDLSYLYFISFAVGYGICYYSSINQILNRGKRLSACALCILMTELIMTVTFPLITNLRTVDKAEEVLIRMGYTEIEYHTNTSPISISWVFSDPVPEMSEQEKKTDLYVYTAIRQGEKLGILISPTTGRIIAQAPISENKVLNLLIQY